VLQIASLLLLLLSIMLLLPVLVFAMIMANHRPPQHTKNEEY
jgi:hypothetical protein